MTDEQLIKAARAALAAEDTEQDTEDEPSFQEQSLLLLGTALEAARIAHSNARMNSARFIASRTALEAEDAERRARYLAKLARRAEAEAEAEHAPRCGRNRISFFSY